MKAHLALALVGIAGVCSAAPLPRTLLFVDDEDVYYRSGTRKVVEPLVKHSSLPVVRPDKPWEGMLGWVSVYRDRRSGKFQMWYQCYTPAVGGQAQWRIGDRQEKRPEDSRLRCVVAYAESTDGVAWTKPNLGLHSFYDFADTNIVLVGNERGYGDRYCNSVLVDLRDADPARRYKMLYYDWDEDAPPHRGAGTRVAFSPDGVHWTKHGPMVSKTSFGAKGKQVPFADEGPYVEGPPKNGRPTRSWLVPLSMSDAQDVFYDDLKRRYVSYGKMWIQGPDGGTHWKHGMGRMESVDFLRWSKPQFILGPDDRDPPQHEFHTSPVFPYNGQYLSLNQILNRSAGTMDVELMTSRDGLNWQRPYVGRYSLARGAPGTFDAATLLTNGNPIDLGDDLYFYYGGYRGTAIGAVGLDRQVVGSDDLHSGIGLAKARRDRFAAIEPDPRFGLRNSLKVNRESIGKPAPTLAKPNRIGQATLRPLALDGVREITVNTNAARGKVAVELLTEDGYRVRGFAKDDAVPIAADVLAGPAAWKEKSLADLPPGRYMLRIHLDNAKLYAVTLK